MKYTNTIQNWFKGNCGGSLLLPDGWYGRPYDNQHRLTFIQESGNTLTMVLDDKLTFYFEGISLINAQKNELIIGPFEKLRFDWQSYGDDGAHGTREYHSGEVKVIIAPG